MDRHSCQQNGSERERETATPRRRASLPRSRPGGGYQRHSRRRSQKPRRPQRPQTPHRFVHIPRHHRRGQDRTCQSTGRIPFRRREYDDANRYERVPGEALRIATGGSASGICGLRRRRTADRGSAAQALFGSAVRRNRESTPRRVQHTAASARRRTPHRQQRPQRQLQEHNYNNDVEHGVAAHSRKFRQNDRQRPRGNGRENQERSSGNAQADHTPRISEPHRRNNNVHTAQPA